MWESILCPQDELLEWHRRNCFMGDCDSCGVDTMAICLIEEEGSSSAMVKWKQFSMEKIVIRKGEETKKLRLLYKSIVSSELMQYLKPKLQFFACHNFVASWQDKMFKPCLQNFTNDTIVLVIDFAINFSFEIQNEVQSMHWHNYQVAILVHITWVKKPCPNLHDENSKNFMKYYFYIFEIRVTIATLFNIV